MQEWQLTRKALLGKLILVLALGVIAPSANADGSVELRICTTGDYKPLTYRDPATGQYSGIDIDMAGDLASQLGRQPVFVATSWPKLMADMTAGRCDIAMGGISVTPERAEVADFTQSYLTNGKTPLVARENADKFDSVDQINQPDVRVIENSGGTNERFARTNLPNATLTIWPDNTTIFDQLRIGAADVMITDAIEAEYQASQHPDLVAVHPDRPFTSDSKAYLLPNNSPLLGQVDEWLSRALNNGTFAGCYQRWVD